MICVAYCLSLFVATTLLLQFLLFLFTMSVLLFNPISVCSVMLINSTLKINTYMHVHICIYNDYDDDDNVLELGRGMTSISNHSL